MRRTPNDYGKTSLKIRNWSAVRYVVLNESIEEAIMTGYFRQWKIYFSIVFMIFIIASVLHADVPNPFQGPMRNFLTRWSKYIEHPERTIDIQHMVLRVKVDEKQKTINATVEYTFVPLRDRIPVIRLHAGPELMIQSLSIDGEKVVFHHSGDQLEIVPKSLSLRDTHVLSITYTGKPKKGLYFVMPDMAYPNIPVQVWTQGEAINTRGWLPTYDWPDDRFTTETYWTVRKPYRVIANGKLIEQKEGPEEGWWTFHWKEDVAHSSYLISVVIGEFREVKDMLRDIPVLYYVPLHISEDITRKNFKRTPEIIEFYEKLLDEPYPYEKYAQTLVYNFLYGGMENISATTLTVNAVRDEIALIESRPDGLIAHELVHQWFGDLLTCKGWDHLWLNEGFATYFTALWFRHDKGQDEFDWRRYGHLRSYLNEGKKYKRPLKWNVATFPDDFFDRHTYPKGALILHMLHTLLGEKGFLKGIQYYIDKNRVANVEASDLKKAFEKVTGVSLDQFFDEWVYHAGHPVLEIVSEWDGQQKILNLTIEQVQETSTWIPYFHLKLPLEIYAGNKVINKTLDISRRHQEYHFELPEKPDMVLIDPGSHWLKEVRWEREPEWLINQAIRAQSVIDRAEAVKALGKLHDEKVLATLKKVLSSDSFYGVRQIAAEVLGKFATEKACRILYTYRTVEDVRVRRSVISNMRKCTPQHGWVSELKKIYNRERAYGVRAACISTLAHWEKENLWKWLIKQLQKPSYQHQIARAVIRSFAEMKEGKKELEAVRLLKNYARYGKPVPLRVEAIMTLSGFRKADEELTKFLESFTTDAFFRVREAAVRAIGRRKHKRSLPVLWNIVYNEVDDGLRTEALHFIDDIELTEKIGSEESVSRDDVLNVKKELEKKIEELEKTIESLKTDVQTCKSREHEK